MSDIFKQFRSTAIQGVFYGLGNFVGKFSGIILLPVYSMYLPVDVFGLYALFEVIFQVFQVFSGLGIKLGLTRWYWDKNVVIDRKSLFFSTLVFNTVVCILLSVGLYFSFDFLSKYYFKTPINPQYITLFIIGNFLKLLSEVPMLLLRVQHKAKKHSIIQITQLLFFVLLVVLCLAVFKLQLDGIFWATIISAVLQVIILIPVVVQNSIFKFNFGVVIDMLRYGFPVALGNMVNVIFNFTDKYFINWFSGLKNVGTFTLAHKISNTVNLLVVNAFMNAYMHSYFKTLDDRDNDIYYSRSFTYFFTVITFFSLLLIVFIKELIVLFTANNEDYYSSVFLIPVLSIGLIFGGMRQMLILPINKIKKTRVIGVLSVVAGIANVVLNYIFIPKWNALGAAYSTAIVQIVSVVFLFYYVKQNTGIQFERKRILLVSFTSCIVLFILYMIPINTLLISILFKFVLISLWLVILYRASFLLPQEKLRLLQLWSKWKDISNLTSNIKSLRK